jgi:DNA-binding CsgD family transcriptional regulator
MQARQAYADRRFGAALEAFGHAGPAGARSADDLLAWSGAAWWLGRAEEALALAELGHRRLLADGSTTRAAQEAIGLGFLLMLRGDLAEGSGWIQRGRSLLEQSSDELAAGYAAQFDAEDALRSGDPDRAVERARAARDVARRAGDHALLSLALMTEGTARLGIGPMADGLSLLDEAMLPVQAGAVPPDFAGNLYCQMIAICWELADLRRAREWTAAIARWCAGFESAVMFSGICRMHQVQLRQVAGEWDLAAEQASVVCAELVGMNVAVVAEGHYLRADLLRLRGRVDEAAAGYLRAHELGRDPQPGLALLGAQSGAVGAAVASVRSSLTAHRGPAYGRAPLLRALVDLALEARDLEVARGASAELAGIARRWRSDGLLAAAAQAGGAVALASGQPAEAMTSLREAVARWRELDAPYDCARARVVLAQALSALGDDSSARLERRAAERALTGLGAAVDLRRLAGSTAGGTASPGGLTSREAEILALVARGDTNRQVAAALVISEKTVARHLANVHRKLGVSTRTAAVAWARRNGLPEAPPDLH